MDAQIYNADNLSSLNLWRNINVFESFRMDSCLVSYRQQCVVPHLPPVWSWCQCERGVTSCLHRFRYCTTLLSYYITILLSYYATVYGCIELLFHAVNCCTVRMSPHLTVLLQQPLSCQLPPHLSSFPGFPDNFGDVDGVKGHAIAEKAGARTDFSYVPGHLG